MLGEEVALTNIVQLLIKGVTLPDELLEKSIEDVSNPPPLRCGAAAKILLNQTSAGKTTEVQSFLTAWIVNDGSYSRQCYYGNSITRQCKIIRMG